MGKGTKRATPKLKGVSEAKVAAKFRKVAADSPGLTQEQRAGKVFGTLRSERNKKRRSGR